MNDEYITIWKDVGITYSEVPKENEEIHEESQPK
jgi:hypothetical protein